VQDPSEVAIEKKKGGVNRRRGDEKGEGGASFCMSDTKVDLRLEFKRR